MSARRRILLVQLPIPPVGPDPIRGNVPLAAGYLKLLARSRGLESYYDIEILAMAAANTLGDQGLVEAILMRGPFLVGFTCYLWNIDRTLWIAARLKERCPDLRVVLGGPEITADNAWVLEQMAVDYAAIGEGEQTFCELLQALVERPAPTGPIDGLYVAGALAAGESPRMPAFRRPLANLDEISSPYLAGILDAADERMLLLETIRGCVFKCKFCYYPKSYDSLYFLSEEKITANLEHARRHGAREVVLLDPTLNQRRDFDAFLRLLARANPERQFTFFGELRAEGITPATARLLREANFTEVEIGLQSIDPLAQELMDRKNNLKAFERGARAMLDAGIDVKVDLIVGLPGDTVESVRRGLDYLCSSRLYSTVQVFNLAVLPGTAFRQESEELGLKFQPRPPYYALGTPTLRLEDFYDLLHEAQERLGIEYDPLPPPTLEFADDASRRCLRLDCDEEGPRTAFWPAPTERGQALTLWLRSRDFHTRRLRAAEAIERVLADNPFTTLQVVLEPTGDPRRLTATALDALARACFRQPTYLDRFYAVQPGRPKGAKRLVVLAPRQWRAAIGAHWIDEVGEYGALVWRGVPTAGEELESHEYAFADAQSTS
ncbi:MAG TPA: radical SAM protein [Pirellulales bacterium]|nr:radical SAM protein [Pirellulales bacterium]